MKRFVMLNYLMDGLELSEDVAHQCHHQGECDADVERCMELPEVKEQLDAMEPELLKKELEAYGAWSDEELSDHRANQRRILWLVAGDITDGNYHKDEEEE